MKLLPAKNELSHQDSPKLFKIGAMAGLLGISASMIRAWEKLGLAQPLRTTSGYRLYTSEDLRVLKRAVYLRKVLGLNAPAIINQLKQDGILSANHVTSPDGVALGLRLRKLRLDSGKSLAQVAKSLGISIGFVSNLERGQVNASIAMLRRIAQHYGANILDFFNTRNEIGIPLVRSKDRKILSWIPGVQMELLAWGKIIMEPHIFRVASQAGSPEFYAHEGEEFLYIIEGELVIHLQETAYHLRTGDSFYFESKTPHRWINPAKSITTILWINTPPTF
jgi:DNA-binding transcriptional MerR regulator/mannose-6-phosphate isomerase-like protein (cupin superfamily)